MATTGFRRWGWLLIVSVLCAGLLVVAGSGRAGNARALAATDPSDDSITVTGLGGSNGVPDTLTANFSVRVRRPTVQAALDAEARFANRLLDALHAAGLEDKDIQTTDSELFRYHNHKSGVTGYFASESVRAEITPLSSAGKTISDATASSGHVNLDGISLNIAKDDDLVKQARDNAYADAKARAEQYAGLSGRSLARVEHITEKVSGSEPEFFGAVAAGSSGVAAHAPLPISGGEQTLTVRVTVVWQLA
jgi:uncharacterized protein